MLIIGKKYDILVVGAGHAGIEAAWAASGMGCIVGIVTMDPEATGRMSCNPAIGGTAKGHLVKEIDALGGLMGRIADDTGIQFRMLNKSKGPAIWSPRSQNDRELYSVTAKKYLQQRENITIIKGMVDEIYTEGGKIKGIVLSSGMVISCKALIITSGTFLNAIMHTGLNHTEGGRYGEQSATRLSKSLLKHNFTTGRLKTGTPPRLEKSSIDFSVCEVQPGDLDPEPFSIQTKGKFPALDQISCFITHTNPAAHKELEKGFEYSPMFTGKIKGVGPRYCPSIEDKIYRFSDKPRHQIFLEPEGLDTNVIYMNGFSSSLPAEIQQKALQRVKGLEKAVMLRPGYAVEYDFFPTYQIKLTLETKFIKGLYFAGQINGTSGYEEAAAQGLMAGINAALKLKGEEPFILKRSEAYIGVLIDDLINKCPDEPYRMFTSSAEYRLILRQDNADRRLLKYGHKFGLIPEEFHKKQLIQERLIQNGLNYFKQEYIPPKAVNDFLVRNNSSSIQHSENAAQIVKRNEIKLDSFLEIGYFKNNKLISMIRENKKVIEQIEIELKYEGYIKRQSEQAVQFNGIESEVIPGNFDYKKIKSLSSEAREKLSKIKPLSLGQASRIAGVSPSDISILAVYMRG
jgi:tRNA uridine 5-carboxymethylaminomethyl modification enzyme